MKGVTDGGETEQTGPSMMGLAQKSATVEKGHQSLDKPNSTPRACFASNLSQEEGSLKTDRQARPGRALALP